MVTLYAIVEVVIIVLPIQFIVLRGFLGQHKSNGEFNLRQGKGIPEAKKKTLLRGPGTSSWKSMGLSEEQFYELLARLNQKW